jgi:hypothetical protein
MAGAKSWIRVKTVTKAATMICIIWGANGIIAILGRILSFRMEGGETAVRVVALERLGSDRKSSTAPPQAAATAFKRAGGI